MSYILIMDALLQEAERERPLKSNKHIAKKATKNHDFYKLRKNQRILI